jgi:hypothetical protein
MSEAASSIRRDSMMRRLFFGLFVAIWPAIVGADLFAQYLNLTVSTSVLPHALHSKVRWS